MRDKLKIIKKHLVRYTRLSKYKHINDVSIISNTCLAGFLYHDSNKKFTSPTINLFFVLDDYLEFVQDLKYYIEADLECSHKTKEYPVGKIKKKSGNGYIYINFNHYKTFKEAKRKWTERSKRIDWDNLFVIYEGPVFNSNNTAEQNKKALKAYEKFYSCPNGTKVFLSGPNTPTDNENSFSLKFYDIFDGDNDVLVCIQKINIIGKILGRRYYDDINWKKIFNGI